MPICSADIYNINARSLRGAPAPPPGILSVAAMIKNEHEVHIFDQNVVANNFSSFLEDLKPDIVGISVLTGLTISDAIR